MEQTGTVLGEQIRHAGRDEQIGHRDLGQQLGPHIYGDLAPIPFGDHRPDILGALIGPKITDKQDVIGWIRRLEEKASKRAFSRMGTGVSTRKVKFPKG